MDTEAVLQEMGYDGWSTDFAGRLRCPCGNIADPDGQAQCGCKSPLLELGMI